MLIVREQKQTSLELTGELHVQIMARFSEEFQSTITPVVVAFILYNIVGFFGNITVQFIYAFRYPKSHFRCLVLALSFVDLTSCCTTVPMETVSTWYWFNAPSRGLCKAKNLSVQFTGLSAMYMLFVTAVYKYRKICRPFKRQISQKLIIILCCCGIFTSFLCAVPAAVLWDINNHTITVNNVSEFAMICEMRADFHGTLIPMMYRNVLSVYDIFLLATIVLYCFVAKATLEHFRIMKARAKAARPLASNSSNSYTQGESVVSANTLSPSADIGEENLPELETNGRKNSETAKQRTSTESNTTTCRQPRRIDIRKVLIMVIIAGTFSVTFLMALTFGYVFAMRDYQDYNSVGELVALFCCYRFYFINYALNPVVYFVLDGCFRKEVLRLFRFNVTK